MERWYLPSPQSGPAQQLDCRAEAGGGGRVAAQPLLEQHPLPLPDAAALVPSATPGPAGSNSVRHRQFTAERPIRRRHDRHSGVLSTRR